MINYADDDMNWLDPAYLPTVKIFACPSTKNAARPNTAAITTGMMDPRYSYNQSGVNLYADRIHGASVYVTNRVTNAKGKNADSGSGYEVAGF